MADTSIKNLSEDTTPLVTDILPMVQDPSGTPVTKKVTIANVLALASTIPAGAVISGGWAYNAVPTGYLLCDGSAVSRTTYATLFTAISTRYGIGDGATTFNVPNLIAKFIQGIATSSTNPGATGGAVNKTTDASGAQSSNTQSGSARQEYQPHTHTVTDIRPPYVEMTPIIKT